MDLDIVQIKSFCKRRGCSVNDYSSAVFGCALHDYFTNNVGTNEQGKVYEVPKFVNTGLLFSFRQPPKKFKDNSLGNEFTQIPC